MQLRYLVLSLAIATTGLSFPTDGSAIPALPQPHELSAVLAAPHIDMQGARPPSTPGAMNVTWVQRGELSSLDVRNRVSDELGRGHAILVTGPRPEDDEEDGESAIFGYRASGESSLYWRSPQGQLEVITVGAELPLDEAGAAFRAWLEARRNTRRAAVAPWQPVIAGRSLGTARSLGVARSAQAPSAGYVPRIEIIEDRTFAGGRAIRHRIVVLRDVDASTDDKVVIVTAEADQAPSKNGALWNGKFLSQGKGYQLFIPDRYVLTTQLAGVGATVPLTLENYEPKTDGASERNIQETVTVRTTTSAGANFEILNGLEKNDAPHLGKIALDFRYEKERVEETSVSMTLKDYSVEALTRVREHTRTVDWVFPLAQDIASKIDYFEDGHNIHGALNSTTRMTPMMRRANLRGVSVWRIPGSYEGRLDVTTQATVALRVYDSLAETVDRGPDAGARVAFNSRIDLGSPHLTRQPTVRLQSLQGSGKCLSQPDPKAPALVLETCEKGTGGKAQHWYLELDNTYRNRGSRQCLTTDPADGRMFAASCDGAPLTQQWKWLADRIHSLYMGGGTWRLHVRDGGTLSAKFDPARHQPLVSNQYHSLLRPWSSYPNKPSRGDVIPNLGGVSPQIPESYLGFGAVGVDERWQPLPLREGL
ncbi:RICIN domain-containing protein [Luteibacter yeojuensis]|uniref:Ricin-type beta-trefoil lectin domain protein n=1 Tax=Luteibacter yeojuensis TaxID=345309 RepID=A0A7X5QVS2_9GAMM|nr:RICIN domain-containing protein [Luteibacter yeojuensis]NID16313.1 ricin-type beta-trefoil lectin domain protein [Luteibacter yeojuensis]